MPAWQHHYARFYGTVVAEADAALEAGCLPRGVPLLNEELDLVVLVVVLLLQGLDGGFEPLGLELCTMSLSIAVTSFVSSWSAWQGLILCSRFIGMFVLHVVRQTLL